jgi:hypothetical protein
LLTGSRILRAEVPVEPDGRGQGQQPLHDPHEQPLRGAATVLFQPELALEGIDDRLDPLANPTKPSVPVRLVGVDPVL